MLFVNGIVSTFQLEFCLQDAAIKDRRNRFKLQGGKYVLRMVFHDMNINSI